MKIWEIEELGDIVVYDNQVGDEELDGPTTEICSGNIKIHSGKENPADVAKVDEDLLIGPDDFALLQNYPNPFNPETQIMYALPKAANVRIYVYNVIGKKIMTLVDAGKQAGIYNVLWNGRDGQGLTVSGDIYFCVLNSEKYNRTIRMILQK
jgi:hypothetical protein